MRNYYNYFTEVEEYFVRKRGKNLMIAPLDWCLVELWKEQKIPLHIVLRGIDRSFESAAERQRKPPATLYYCHPAVMEAWEEHQAAALGGHQTDAAEGSGDPGYAAAVLEGLIRRLESRNEAPVLRVRQRLEAMLEDSRRGVPLAEPQLEEELSSMQAALVAELAGSIDSVRRRRLEQEIRREVQRYRKRLSPEVAARLQQKYLERRLREELDLPEFSLLAVDGLGSSPLSG